MCVPNGPPFQRCQVHVYDWPSFFDKKYFFFFFFFFFSKARYMNGVGFQILARTPVPKLPPLLPPPPPPPPPPPSPEQTVFVFFLFHHENICCGYSLEAPQWGAYNEYPLHMFQWRNKTKKINPIFPLIYSSDKYLIVDPYFGNGQYLSCIYSIFLSLTWI